MLENGGRSLFRKFFQKDKSDAVILDVDLLSALDKDTKETFGHVNTWWVFSEVAKALDYNVFVAEAQSIGYKRSKRGEKDAPNDLYRADTYDKTLIDDGINLTILDAMRDIEWD